MVHFVYLFLSKSDLTVLWSYYLSSSRIFLVTETLYIRNFLTKYSALYSSRELTRLVRFEMNINRYICGLKNKLQEILLTI